MRTWAALLDLKTAGLLRAFTQRNVGLQSKGDTATDLDEDYRCYSGFTAIKNARGLVANIKRSKIAKQSEKARYGLPQR